jgi:hypothetical protein
MSQNNKELKGIQCRIKDLEAELEYYYLYDQKDTEAIARLEGQIGSEQIKLENKLDDDNLLPRNEPYDSKMELYDEIGVPSSGIADERWNSPTIVTEMCEDLLKQAKESND